MDFVDFLIIEKHNWFLLLLFSPSSSDAFFYKGFVRFFWDVSNFLSEYKDVWNTFRRLVPWSTSCKVLPGPVRLVLTDELPTAQVNTYASRFEEQLGTDLHYQYLAGKVLMWCPFLTRTSWKRRFLRLSSEITSEKTVCWGLWTCMQRIQPSQTAVSLGPFCWCCPAYETPQLFFFFLMKEHPQSFCEVQTIFGSFLDFLIFFNKKAPSNCHPSGVFFPQQKLLTFR